MCKDIPNIQCMQNLKDFRCIISSVNISLNFYFFLCLFLLFFDMYTFLS